MLDASSNSTLLYTRLLEAVQFEHTISLHYLFASIVATPLLTLLFLTAWGHLHLQPLQAATQGPSESPKPDPASAEEPGPASAEEVPVLVPTPPSDGKPPEMLLAHTPESFVAAIQERLGCRSQLPRKLYVAYFKTGVLAVGRAELLANSAEHAAAVLGLCDGTPPLALADADDPEAMRPPRRGETKKYVLRATAPPHHEVEMVVMPAGDARHGVRHGGRDGEAPEREEAVDEGCSLCISSQVGCAQGCSFCETGRMGLLRNLSAIEIVAQVALARFALGIPVSNVVFMGMGEPLDNLDNLVQAIRVMTNFPRLGIKDVTVSTVGLASQVYSLLVALPRVRMAFSVHCADDATRSRLMPINRHVPLVELALAMRHYLQRTKRRLTVQYILLARVNDSVEHAAHLADFLQTVGPANRFHVNLIPYNAQSRPSYETPSPQEAAAFKAAVMARGYFVKIRTTRGAENMAACGQLGNVRLRRQLRLAAKVEAGGGDAPGSYGREGNGCRCNTMGGVDLDW